MKTYHKICISCPAGCHLDISVDDNGEINVAGNTCPRGKTYGINEITNPRRVFTAVVKAKGNNRSFVPVKSTAAIPMEKIQKLLSLLNQIEVDLPIKIGDVIIENFENLNINIIACNDVNI